ncbi:CU044_5270 family protein [Paractinoplanes rishiriensis]|uniref:CU044_5270 family protein n=1 Tax=Paractinoplanes rishiriensis TaxID=1050105 RepID=A0A919JTH6_9ACTN|nr:CU044_5270 family protein [Actinoplanes rishiriensis]GIE93385.1 hypothetical protein Ari01nite_08500 [Actinoplanes rishiriensis]
MNDLDLIKEFRSDLPPADPAALGRARARMFRDPAPGLRSPARPRRRWAWSLVPAGVLAVAVAAAVVVLRPPETVTPLPPDTPSALGAAQVFQLAAAGARKEPELKARPDQFVYVHSRVAWASFNLSGGTYTPPKDHERRIWLSADGKLPGLLREEGPNSNVPLDANVPPAYRADLPTDAKAMRAYLYDGTAGDPKGRSADSLAWTKVGDTLREQYLTPKSVAALFEAAAGIGGASKVSQVDLAGRKGIAVSRTESGVQHDIIFDRSTYRFLGERDVVVGKVDDLPKGATIGWTAQLEVAIVDRAGQLP